MVVGIICIIIEITLLIYIFKRISKSVSFSLKDTIGYPALLLLCTFMVTYGEIVYGSYDSFFTAIPYSLSVSFDLIKLGFTREVYDLFLSNNIYLCIAYFLGYIISFISLFSLFSSVLKCFIKNSLRIRIFCSEINFIIGLNEDSKKFITNLSKEQRRNIVMILDKSNDSLINKEKMFLSDNNIRYVVSDISSDKTLLKSLHYLTLLKNKKYKIVAFYDSDGEIFSFVKNALKFLKDENKYDGSIQFIINTTPSQSYFVKELIKGRTEEFVINLKGKKVKLMDESRGRIRCFDKYELMGFDFIRRFNFAKFMPGKYKTPNGTVKDIDINLFMLGFGKVNQALLKNILIETQFVTIRDNMLVPVRLNTYIYDSEKNINNTDLSMGIFKYKKSELDSSDYLDLPDDYISRVKFMQETNIGDMDFLGNIESDIKTMKQNTGKDSVNYFIVSFGSDFENSSLADKLADSLSCDNNIFFVRNSNKLTLPSFKNKGIHGFGVTDEVYSYDNLICDTLFKQAKIESCVYQGKDANETNYELEWATLNKIKQGQNLFSVSSIPFKMALLGFDYRSYDKQAFSDLYDKNGEEKKAYSYSEKLSSPGNFSPRDVLAFSEHERWNAYELSEGVLPMKLSDAFNKESRVFKNQTDNGQRHLCITTEKGLNDYYEHVKAFEKECGVTGLDADVITYDYDLMDNLTKKPEK